MLDSGLDQAREGEDAAEGFLRALLPALLLLLLLSKYSFGVCDVRVLCWVSKPRRFSWAVFLVCRKRGALHGACLGTVRIVQGGGNPSGVGAQFERQLP